MPTHKITNDFIRKYNKTFAIKGYSKLPISEKIALVRKHVDKVGGAMKTEWDGIMGSSKTKVPKGSHKMPDGSIMKDSAMKKKRQLSSAPNLVKGLEKKKAPKPVYKLKSPRPVGAVARPNRKNRPGAPNSGALGGLTEPKFKSTPKYTLAKKGPSAITMTRKPPSSTMKIVKRTPNYTLAQKGPSAITMTRKPPSSTMKIVKRTPTATVNTPKAAPPAKTTTTQALLQMPYDVGTLISAQVDKVWESRLTKFFKDAPKNYGNKKFMEIGLVGFSSINRRFQKARFETKDLKMYLSKLPTNADRLKVISVMEKEVERLGGKRKASAEENMKDNKERVKSHLGGDKVVIRSFGRGGNKKIYRGKIIKMGNTNFTIEGVIGHYESRMIVHSATDHEHTEVISYRDKDGEFMPTVKSNIPYKNLGSMAIDLARLYD